MSNYIRDAFKSLDLLEDTSFDLDTKDDFQELDTFINDDGDINPEVNVFDLEADEEEELKDSYVGDAILECPVCHAYIFKPMEEVVVDNETELCCVEEECPVCGSEDGFKVIGKVAPFEEEEKSEVEVETEPDDDVEVEVEDKEEIKEALRKRVATKINEKQLKRKQFASKHSLNENIKKTSKKSLKESRSEEIDRIAFGSLIKYNDFPGDKSYGVLNDGYFCYKFMADSDEEAKEIFRKHGTKADTDGHGWLVKECIKKEVRKSLKESKKLKEGYTFEPGYHEWILWKDGDAVKSLGDITVDLPEVCNEDNLRQYAEDLTDQILWDDEDGNVDIASLKTDKSAVEDAIFSGLFAQYGEVVESRKSPKGKKLEEDTWDVTDQIILKRNEPGVISKMHELRDQGYSMSWCGNGLLCFTKPKKLSGKDKIDPVTGEVLESKKSGKGRKLKEAKLSKADREYLRKLGETEDENIDQIEYAVGKTIYTVEDENGKEKRISAKKAREILGDEKFLSGLQRSAFHWSSSRDSDDGITVYFDSSAIFRESKSNKKGRKLKEATTIKGLENAKNVAEEFKNYVAYKANFKPLTIVKQGKDYFVYKEGAKESSDYVQFGSKEYIDGWLYGCVQAKMKIVEGKKLKEDFDIVDYYEHNKEIPDVAYEMASEISDRFSNQKEVTWDDFNGAFEDAFPGVVDWGEDAFNELETDVRGVLGQYGWKTIFEGENEGGLERLSESLKEDKELVETPVYDLNPRFDSRQSFYGKAKVDTGDQNDKNKLYSYDTLVAEIKDGKPVVYGTYSQTTLRHIKDWLKQNGFKAESGKQIMADYGVKEESLKEDIEKATIETEDQVIEVSTEEKEPVEEETAETEEEVVAPLSDEDIAEIETNTDEVEKETPEEELPEEEIPEEEFPEDEEEFEFDGVQEESFHRVVENYMKSTYSNIKSFTVDSIKSNKAGLKLEGKINFNSGKTTDTTFIFEKIANKDSIAKDKARYIGLNETFTDKKNAYVLRVSRNNNTLYAESLRYSYPAKTSKLNESVKLVKGFVR